MAALPGEPSFVSCVWHAESESMLTSMATVQDPVCAVAHSALQRGRKGA